MGRLLSFESGAALSSDEDSTETQWGLIWPREREGSGGGGVREA